MPVYFAKSTQGFYDTDIQQYALPPDAVEIPRVEYRKLLKANERGERIVGDVTGKPVLEAAAAVRDANRLAYGVEILGEGFPNGRYACDTEAVADITTHLSYIGCANAFLTGRTLQVTLYNGTQVTYTDPDVYVRVMRQLLLYVNTCKAYNKGTIKDLPGDTLTIT